MEGDVSDGDGDEDADEDEVEERTRRRLERGILWREGNRSGGISQAAWVCMNHIQGTEEKTLGLGDTRTRAQAMAYDDAGRTNSRVACAPPLRGPTSGCQSGCAHLIAYTYEPVEPVEPWSAAAKVKMKAQWPSTAGRGS